MFFGKVKFFAFAAADAELMDAPIAHKLVAAAESLLEFAKRCKGRPNKDISALTGQIISLIERFRE